MNIGVIFAGGVGSRMHSKDVPKQFLEIHNKPIIIHTLEYFERNDEIDAVVISCVEEWIPFLEKLLYKYRIEKVKKVVRGGATGQLSIYNGLRAAKEVAGDEKSIVLIHDGVRPLISEELLSANIESVKKYGSAITSGIVKETIVIVGEDGKCCNGSIHNLSFHFLNFSIYFIPIIYSYYFRIIYLFVHLCCHKNCFNSII